MNNKALHIIILIGIGIVFTNKRKKIALTLLHFNTYATDMYKNKHKYRPASTIGDVVFLLTDRCYFTRYAEACRKHGQSPKNNYLQVGIQLFLGFPDTKSLTQMILVLFVYL